MRALLEHDRHAELREVHGARWRRAGVPLEVGAVLRAAWDSYTRAPWPMILPGLIGLVITLPFQGMSFWGTLNNDRSLYLTGNLLTYAVSFLYGPLQYVGYAVVTLKAVRGQPVTALDFFEGLRYWHLSLAATIVWTVAVLGGLILCIVPGVILLIGFLFFPYFLVDEKCGPIEALSRSWDATRGRRAELFVIGLVLTLINVAGLCMLYIPLIVLTLPLSSAAQAVAYSTCASTALREQQ